jgi:hypothetical protein
MKAFDMILATVAFFSAGSFVMMSSMRLAMRALTD